MLDSRRDGTLKIMITEQQFRIIDRWISAVETGNPDGDYGKVTVMNDGPNGERQITFGKHQTTETGGNLKALVQKMVDSGVELFEEERAMITQFLASEPYKRAHFPGLLRSLRVMGRQCTQTQDEFFQKKYWFPACQWCKKNGLTTPLAHLVAHDSWIHSGGVPVMLRKRFSEPTPANGGYEIEWLNRYIETRHQWLKHWGDGKSDKSKLLRASSYRTAGLMAIYQSQNFDLTEKPITVNGIKIS